MRKTSRLQSAQALALAAVCAVQVGAAGLVQAQSPAPTPPVVPPAQPAAPQAPATAPTTAAEPATQPPAAEPSQPAAEAAPVPGSTTELTAPSAEPALPPAAEPTSPPAYVEPMQPPDELPTTIEAAPAIDEQLALEPKSNVPSYVMWALGGASLITGTVFGVSALTAKSDFDDMPSYDAADRVEGRAVVADVALGLSAVLLVTGTVFYFLPDSQEPRPTAQNTKRPTARWQVAPMLGRTNGGALSVQF